MGWQRGVPGTSSGVPGTSKRSAWHQLDPRTSWIGSAVGPLALAKLIPIVTDRWRR